MKAEKETLVLGVGNLLLKDEGVGIHVIKALENEKLPAHVHLMDGGTGGLHLLSWLQGYDRIIMIDATLDNNLPGTVRLIQPRYATDFPPLMSAHEIGLKDMIDAMILTDDNFATIVGAVAQGRVLYMNILKAIQFLLSSNLGEVLLIFVATVLNLGSPLLPIHILWVNLITDSLPALALGMEPAEPDVMDLPPRDPRSPIFTRPLLLRVIYQGLMIAGLSLAAYLTGARVSPDTGHTMAFAVLAFSQLAHAFNVRSNTHSAFMRGKMNRWMIPAFLSGIALQLCVLLVPFLQGLFRVAALTPAQWGLVALLSLMPLPIVEMLKALGLTGESRTKR